MNTKQELTVCCCSSLVCKLLTMKNQFSPLPPPLSIPLQVVEEEGEEEATMDRYVCVCVTAPSSCHAIHMHVRTYVCVFTLNCTVLHCVGK